MARPAWQVKKPEVTEYAAAYTLTKFHYSTERVLPFAQLRGIMGPLGSGKSVGMCWEIMMQAHRMPANEDGVRRSKWVVIRNTYRELEDTTLQTWLEWFPEQQFGRFLRRGMTHEIRRKLADGTTLELDVMFRALDRPQDVKKLLSLECTCAWVNEAREIPRAIIDMLRKRVGRFPRAGSVDPYWFGVIMDTNPPEENSWWYKYAETTDWRDFSLQEQLKRTHGIELTMDDIESGFQFFRQPSGRRDSAENVRNLPPGYYSTVGYNDDWIKVYIDGEYGYVRTGLPVYPEFYEQTHYMADLQPIRASIMVGLDFGLTPAAVFIQQDVRGRFLVIDELCTRTDDDDNQVMGITNFAERLKAYIATHYAGYEFRFVGDPAGDERSQLDENQTVFKVLRKHGINAKPCITQDPIKRRDAIGMPLTALVDGKPRLIIGGKCQMVRMGLAGKYEYKSLNVKAQGDERKFHIKPDKNDYSHPIDALQYGLIALGSNPEKPKVMGGQAGQVTQQAETHFDIWEATHDRRRRHPDIIVPPGSPPLALASGVHNRGSPQLVGSVPEAWLSSRLCHEVGRLQLAGGESARRLS